MHASRSLHSNAERGYGHVTEHVSVRMWADLLLVRYIFFFFLFLIPHIQSLSCISFLPFDVICTVWTGGDAASWPLPSRTTANRMVHLRVCIIMREEGTPTEILFLDPIRSFILSPRVATYSATVGVLNIPKITQRTVVNSWHKALL